MSHTPFFAAAALALLGTAVVPPSAAPVRAAAKAFVVVVSAGSDLREIKSSELRRTFQGLPTEIAGTRLIPMNLPQGTPARAFFDAHILGLQPDEVGAFWIDRRIRDESPPPRTAPNIELARRIAATLPGAITYLAREELNNTVRVLAVDGHLPDDPAYPLQ